MKAGGVRGMTVNNGFCNQCAHVRDDGLTCRAFPKGIPLGVLRGDFDHRQPYDDGEGTTDGGVLFELRPGFHWPLGKGFRG